MAAAEPNEAASLTSVPIELLDQVAGLLPRSALRALALTCKKTNKSANDVLFKTYLNRTAPAKAPFYLFLRTLCERPDLAAKVKLVDIRGWRSWYEVAVGAAWRGLTQKRDVDEFEREGLLFSTTEKKVVRGSAKARFEAFVEAAVNAGLIPKPTSSATPALKSSMIWYTSLKDDGDFIRLLGRGVEDAQLILMLALLPNLHELHVDELSPFPLLDWHQFLSRPTTALRAVSIMSISGSNTTPSEPRVTNSLQFLDIMPNLQGLFLYDVDLKGHGFALTTIPSKKLSHVDFHNCGMTRRLFRKLVNDQHLIRFKSVSIQNQVSIGTAADLSAPDMVVALASSKLSLKDMALFPGIDSGARSSLRSFENLENVETPHPGFLGMPIDAQDPETIASLLQQQLPNTLRTIGLRYLGFDLPTKVTLEQLAHLKVQVIFPALTSVRLNFQQSRPTSFAYTLESFMPGGPGVGGQRTTWDTMPDVTAKVHEDLDKLYGDAGISMEVQQTDW